MISLSLPALWPASFLSFWVGDFLREFVEVGVVLLRETAVGDQREYP